MKPFWWILQTLFVTSGFLACTAQTMNTHEHIQSEAEVQKLLAAMDAPAESVSSFPQAAKRPPNGEQVYTTLNEYWVEGRFDALESYVTDLEKDWPNYVPSLLARATYAFNQGDQSEDLSLQLKGILESAHTFPASFSPTFRDAVASEVLRHDTFARLFSENGISKADRLEMKAPHKIKRLSWGFAELFALAPEISLPESDSGQPVEYEMESGAPAPLVQLDTSELVKVITNREADASTRVDAINALRESHDSSAIAPLLATTADNDWQVSTQAAKALRDFGKEPVPIVCDALRNSTDTAEIKLLIWALIRSESRDEMVRTTLKTELKSRNPTVIAYQREAAQVLFDED